MKVFVRADASLAIGSGHVMRCLVLADALAARGAAVTFVCREHEGHIGEIVAARGHAVVLLPLDPDFRPAPDTSPYARWLATDPAADARATRAAIETAGGCDLLIVDHYGLDARWEVALRAVVGRILVVDDLADRPHDCDLLLDQNIGADEGDRYAGRVGPTTRLLLGPAHALLMPDFARARRPRDGSVRRILVFFGGVDANDATRAALQGIVSAGLAGVEIDAVVGHSNPHRAALEAFAARHLEVRLLPPQPSLAPLVAASDLAVGAGGVTALERAAAGLPSLVVAIAENQIAPARGLAAAGGCLYLGTEGRDLTDRVRDAVACAAHSPDLVRHLGTASEVVCDGRGLSRLVDLLMPPRVDLRPATLGDAETMWRWRNHPQTRKHSGDPREIPLEGHLAWVEATLARTDRTLLIGSDDGGPFGVLRYDFADDRAVVSVYLDPSRHGRGLGPALLRAGTAHVARVRPEIRRIEAVVKSANTASARAFANAGYRLEESVWEIDPATAR